MIPFYWSVAHLTTRFDPKEIATVVNHDFMMTDHSETQLNYSLVLACKVTPRMKGTGRTVRYQTQGC